MRNINKYHSMLFAGLNLFVITSTYAVEQPHMNHRPSALNTQLNDLTADGNQTELKDVVDMHSSHLKEHGGQIYQATKVESKWQTDREGNGRVQTAFETRIGTDENKLFIQAQIEKVESEKSEYQVKALYSRAISNFWDVQTGVQYRRDLQANQTIQRYDAVVGLHGLAPYFFETDAYLYVGQDNYQALSLETERDLLLNQKLILKPYLDADIVFQDQSQYAKKNGLSTLQLGLELRYEISKKVMPYLDLAYVYRQGQAQTLWQAATSSDKQLMYGAGLRFKF